MLFELHGRTFHLSKEKEKRKKLSNPKGFCKFYADTFILNAKCCNIILKRTILVFLKELISELIGWDTQVSSQYLLDVKHFWQLHAL